MDNNAYGYGKTILFGEHFVVYGLQAIVCALDCKTTAKIDKINCAKNFELIDLRPKIPNFVPKFSKEYNLLVQNIINFSKVKNNLKITLEGNLPVCSGGIGASAATAVAISRAINLFFNLGWDDYKINTSAYEGEKAVHGSPSGIDNTAATFGGTFLYKKEDTITNYNIQKIDFAKSELKNNNNLVEIVLADSAIQTGTKTVLNFVRSFKDKNHKKFETILKKYSELVCIAEKYLINFDFVRVGDLMNKNHEFLKQINISCDKIENMIKIARKAGAFGVKITGTGCGGLILALTPSKELQQKVANALKSAGYFVFCTNIKF